MQDPLTNLPSCFFSSSNPVNGSDHRHRDPTAVTRPGQSVVMSLYSTKIADLHRTITITWCRNLLLHGLSVTIDGPVSSRHHTCKIELKPWYFWRKHGVKNLHVEGRDIRIFWDLRAARFHGETEPSSEFFVAVVCDDEVVLLVGDLKQEAYRKTCCRPALTDPALLSRKEHIFGKRRFSTRARFHDKDKLHEISIECGGGTVINSSSSSAEPEMEIRLDGQVLVHVKHLQWKFRGNEAIHVKSLRLEVFWDVHDWLFGTGLRHALFIFKPVFSSSGSVSSLSSSSSPFSSSMSSQAESNSGPFESFSAGGLLSEFCLFLFAWKGD